MYEVDFELPPAGCLVRSDEVLLLRAGGMLFGATLPDLSLRPIGQPACGSIVYNSLAAARTGEAYVVDTDNNMFRVNADLSCEGPLFVTPPTSYFVLGMTMLGDASGHEAIEYVEQDLAAGHTVNRLGTIDPAGSTREHGPEIPGPPRWMELGGGADGRLFGLDAGSFDRPRSLFELNPTTGEVENERAFGTGVAASSLALVRFKDVLYGFVQHGLDQRSQVFSFELDGGKATEHDPAPIPVIGAGASTCADDSERPNP